MSCPLSGGAKLLPNERGSDSMRKRHLGETVQSCEKRRVGDFEFPGGCVAIAPQECVGHQVRVIHKRERLQLVVGLSFIVPLCTHLPAARMGRT